MRFEISNPHDPYFMDAESFTDALAAIALLGEGDYGITPVVPTERVPDVPPNLFSDWPDEIYNAAGIVPPNASGLMNWLQTRANNEATAKALDSIRCPRKKTSTVDLERRGREMAAALRGRRTFASIKE